MFSEERMHLATKAALSPSSITLKDTKPPIPSTFRIYLLGFEIARQNATGWFDCHLHEYSMLDKIAIVSGANMMPTIWIPFFCRETDLN